MASGRVWVAAWLACVFIIGCGSRREPVGPVGVPAGECMDGVSCEPPAVAAPAAVRCAVGEATYEVGQVFAASEGCGQCVCGGDGVSTCTNVPCACDDLDRDVCVTRADCVSVVARRVEQDGVCLGDAEVIGCRERAACAGTVGYALSPAGDAFLVTPGCLPSGWQPHNPGPVQSTASGRDRCRRDCVYQGERYDRGQVFAADGGCNTCTCGDDRTVTCVPAACAKPPCERLSPADCSVRSDCQQFTGHRYDEALACAGAAQVLGCGAASIRCQSDLRLAEDPDGNAFVFETTCIPDGLVETPLTNPFANRRCETKDACAYQGTLYSVGDLFEAGDDCNVCSCSPVGTVTCSDLACDAGPTCDYDGTRHDAREVFPSAVDCNLCSCDAQGGVVCTRSACLGCERGGRWYPDGVDFHDPEGCGVCSCRGGVLSCTQDPSTDGHDGAEPRLRCVCEAAGQRYHDGERYAAGDGCNTCVCQANGPTVGDGACTERACPTPPAAECTSDFDPGPCAEPVLAFWFNPQRERCETRMWGGCGGNGNRYRTLADCEQRCGSAGLGADCRLPDGIYPNGNVTPDPMGCNACTCVDGALTACTEAKCAVETRVFD